MDFIKRFWISGLFWIWMTILPGWLELWWIFTFCTPGEHTHPHIHTPCTESRLVVRNSALHGAHFGATFQGRAVLKQKRVLFGFFHQVKRLSRRAITVLFRELNLFKLVLFWKTALLLWLKVLKKICLWSVNDAETFKSQDYTQLRPNLSILDLSVTISHH